jgi:phosphoribosyl 1,2-cyclic phosphate phosphodiesterase
MNQNRRTRASILVENKAGSRILVDTGTDLRQQLLANDIHRLDAVFWTHDHADHCHGIDDLRPLRYGRGGPIAGYAVDETMRRLRNRFSYVFSGQHGYHTLVEIEGLDRLKMCAGFGVGWAQMPHGPAQSTAASTAMASPSAMQLISVQLRRYGQPVPWRGPAGDGLPEA